MIKFWKIIIIFIFINILIPSSSVFAKTNCVGGDFPLEIPIFGLSCVSGPAAYLSGLYKISLGVGVFIVAVVIVISGTRYAAARDNINTKKDAVSRIWGALGGLALLFGSFVLLNTINPRLTELEDLDIGGDISEKDLREIWLRQNCHRVNTEYNKVYWNCVNEATKGLIGYLEYAVWSEIYITDNRIVDNCTQKGVDSLSIKYKGDERILAGMCLSKYIQF